MIRYVTLSILGFCLLACAGNESKDPSRDTIGAVGATVDSDTGGEESSLPSQSESRSKGDSNDNWRVRRDSLSEAKRAQLHVGGLVVDVGSADMHKYSRGGWGSGWGRNQLDGEDTVARVDASTAWLDVTIHKPVKEIVLRARGHGKLKISIGKVSGSVSLGASLREERIVLRKPIAAGRHRILIRGRKADIDWLWMSEEIGAAIPSFERVAQESKTILAAPTPRLYQYTVIPEKEDVLRFWSKGDAKGQARISLAQDGRTKEFIVDAGLSETWTIHEVELKGWAGRATQFNFENVKGAAQWREPALVQRVTKPSKSNEPVRRPKNVVVLLIDTQRADSFSVVGKNGGVGAKGYESLVGSSATFKNAYNNENWTKPSIASLDTGLYPTSHLARWRKDRCSKDLVFLSEHLQGKGFATAGLVSNLSAGAKYGFNQGWDSFEKTDNAKLTFARALEWLDSRDKDKRFFLYVQTIDPHVPFSVPQGSAEAIFGGPYNGKIGPSFEQSEEDALNEGKLKLSAEDNRWLRALYDAEVLYHDTYLQKFVAGLKERSLLKDTLFVILNDHGEEFGEEGRWGHSWTMGDALFRSPLLMHFPGLFPGTTFEEVVEHIDVAPTIVDSLGLDAMPDAQGTSFLDLMRGQSHSARYPYTALLFGRPKRRALRIGDYKLRVQNRGKVELYDRLNDPKESKDLSDSHAIARQLCESAMGEAIANPRRSERLSDLSIPVAIRSESVP